MAFNQPHHLSPSQIRDLFSNFVDGQHLEVVSIRYKNKDEIRKLSLKPASELESFILNCIKEEDQPGGDMEVIFPDRSVRLVGHHDGVYWLEEQNA